MSAGLSAPCLPPTVLAPLCRPAFLWGSAPYLYSSETTLLSHSVLALSVQGLPACAPAHCQTEGSTARAFTQRAFTFKPLHHDGQPPQQDLSRGNYTVQQSWRIVGISRMHQVLRAWELPRGPFGPAPQPRWPPPGVTTSVQLGLASKAA